MTQNRNPSSKHVKDRWSRTVLLFGMMLDRNRNVSTWHRPGSVRWRWGMEVLFQHLAWHASLREAKKGRKTAGKSVEDKNSVSLEHISSPLVFEGFLNTVSLCNTDRIRNRVTGRYCTTCCSCKTAYSALQYLVRQILAHLSPNHFPFKWIIQIQSLWMYTNYPLFWY